MNLSSRKIVAILQIGGGCFGVALTLRNALGMIPNWRYTFLLGVLAIPFLLAVYAGQRLWKGDPRGYNWSILLQLIQVPIFIWPSFFYRLYIAGELSLLWMDGDLSFNWGLGGYFGVRVEHASIAGGFGLNFLALWAFYSLIRTRPGRAVSQEAAAVNTAPA